MQMLCKKWSLFFYNFRLSGLSFTSVFDPALESSVQYNLIRCWFRFNLLVEDQSKSVSYFQETPKTIQLIKQFANENPRKRCLFTAMYDSTEG